MPEDTEAARQRLGATFLVGGERYHALRPGYPREAVSWLTEPAPGQPARVVEIGAGTGKLTQILVELGHQVVAVEPSANMRAQLSAALPSVDARGGTGEATGCPAGSADVVAYGQAWHWVEPVAGSAEAVRLLAPGGVLALAWNTMDVEVEWVDRLSTAMHSGDARQEAGQCAESAAQVRAPLHLQERASFHWLHRLTTADLAALVTTRSYYLERDRAGQVELAARVGAVVAAIHGDVDERIVELPHITEAYRFVLD